MNDEEHIETDKVPDGTLDDPDIRDSNLTNEIINLETTAVKSRMQVSIDKCDWTLVEKEDIPKVQFFIIFIVYCCYYLHNCSVYKQIAIFHLLISIYNLLMFIVYYLCYLFTCQLLASLNIIFSLGTSLVLSFRVHFLIINIQQAVKLKYKHN